MGGRGYEVTIFGDDVHRAGRAIPGAFFLRIAWAVTWAANNTGSSKLAFTAAVLVGIAIHLLADLPNVRFLEKRSRESVLANCIVDKLAGSRVTALIGTTAFGTATVTVFTCFDDTIPAFIFSDDTDVFVGGQARGVDAPSFERRTYVPNRTRTESLDLITGRRVHEISSTSVASGSAEWATHGCSGHGARCGTSLRCAIVHSPHGMTNLVRDDFPLG